MKIKLLFLIVLFSSCSSNELPVSENDEYDTIVVEEIQPYQLQETDKIHIDYVQYLEETDEYALPLIWKKGVDILTWYESVVGSIRDTIYSNDSDYTRYKIPDSLIPQFFDVSTFKNVKLYNRENAYCGAGEFQRFEHIDQNIDPIPVAVYKLKKINKEASYAVAGLDTILPAISSEEAPEVRLKQLIDFKLPKKYKEAYSLRNGFMGKQFYSIQGYSENEFTVFSEIYLEENGKLTKVHKNDEFWYYFDVHPIPIYNEQQPVLLCNFCKSESDWFRSNVLIFEDGKYVGLR